jgi:hypothetical protein
MFNTLVFFKGNKIVAHERVARPMAKLEAWRTWFMEKNPDKYTDISIYAGMPTTVCDKNGSFVKMEYAPDAEPVI